MLSGDVQTFLILANACSCRESLESIVKVKKLRNKKPQVGRRWMRRSFFRKNDLRKLVDHSWALLLKERKTIGWVFAPNIPVAMTLETFQYPFCTLTLIVYMSILISYLAYKLFAILTDTQTCWKCIQINNDIENCHNMLLYFDMNNEY